MDMQSLSTLTHNPHFLSFVAILSVPQSAGWRMKHSEVPSVRAKLDRLMKLSKSLLGGNRDAFLEEFVETLVSIVNADESLRHSKEDMYFIVETLDSKDAPLIFSLLFAYASCPVRWFSAEQLTEFTDKAPSTWRNLAADGQILGARKVGKTWMFPESGLAAYGVELPPPLTIEIEEKESEVSLSKERKQS